MANPGYDSHPIRTTISHILDLEKQPEFADPAISTNERNCNYGPGLVYGTRVGKAQNKR